MNRGWTFATVVLVVVALAGGPMAAAADTTTLTIAVESRSGEPIADATIVATWDGGSTTAQTANNGKAFVDVPAEQRVQIVIEHANFTRNVPYVIEDPTGVSGEVVVPVAPKASLAVTVRDQDSVVPNARVAIRWEGHLLVSRATGDHGRLALRTVEAGTYHVTVEKPGYYVNQTTVSVANDTETTVRIRTGSVPYEFTVTDSHFSPPEPVAGATVHLADVGTVQTGPDGLATARLPVNAEVDLRVTKNGYDTVTRTLTVNETGGTVSVDLQRTPSLSLTAVNDRVVVGESVVVTVRNAYGESVVDATILRNGTAIATTDANGQAIVPLESAGTWRLVATADDRSSPAVSVEVIDPDATTTTTQTTTTESDATTETSTETTSVLTPGFGLIGAFLALAVALGLANARRR